MYIVYRLSLSLYLSIYIYIYTHIHLYYIFVRGLWWPWQRHTPSQDSDGLPTFVFPARTERPRAQRFGTLFLWLVKGRRVRSNANSK